MHGLKMMQKIFEDDGATSLKKEVSELKSEISEIKQSMSELINFIKSNSNNGGTI